MGSEMCIRDSASTSPPRRAARDAPPRRAHLLRGPRLWRRHGRRGRARRGMRSGPGWLMKMRSTLENLASQAPSRRLGAWDAAVPGSQTADTCAGGARAYPSTTQSHSNRATSPPTVQTSARGPRPRTAFQLPTPCAPLRHRARPPATAALRRAHTRPHAQCKPLRRLTRTTRAAHARAILTIQRLVARGACRLMATSRTGCRSSLARGTSPAWLP